jgi:hypothetical protein
MRQGLLSWRRTGCEHESAHAGQRTSERKLTRLSGFVGNDCEEGHSWPSKDKSRTVDKEGEDERIAARSDVGMGVGLLDVLGVAVRSKAN